MPEKVNVLIIGSGPAGYTAAIYAARAGLSPVMYQGMQPGGQLMITNDVENFPGYPKGIMGPEMMEDFKEQAQRFGTDIRYGMATAVQFTDGGTQYVTIDDTHEIETEAVIIATGASAKWLGIPSEEKYNGRGVSACAVCDGFFFRGQDVAIVGAGDTACEEATYLSKLCKTVHMIVRKNEMRASVIMQNRVKNTPNIVIHWNSITDEISGNEGVEKVRIKNTLTGMISELSVTGFFVAIGHKPNTDIFKGQIDMDENGYIVTEKVTSKTSLQGVFACGDAQDFVYRQAVTAAGTGCMAALDAEKYLASKEIVQAVH
ncbi:MAG: thioredoxin-disulfide reductase [Cytophagales bacterium]|nr:thioredoxin-disulfide reductase [Cytophagales bacterium]